MNDNLKKLSKKDLIQKCKENNIKGYSTKNKSEIIELIKSINVNDKINIEEIVKPDILINTVTNTNILENNNKLNLNVIDLFCGCGGMSKGLTDAGMNIIAGIDVWDKAIVSYRKNFHHEGICEDLTKLPPEKFNELYNKKNETIDLIVGGPPCFIAGTKVLTNTGYKNIENIKITEQLLTHTGKYQNIINLQKKNYTGTLYELDISNHFDKIICTEEHPFYIRRFDKYNNKFKQPEWKNAKDLTLNDYYGMIINNNNIIPEFSTFILDKSNYWYMMGHFIGCEDIEKKTIDKILLIYNQECNNEIWYNIFKEFGTCINNLIIPNWIHNAPIEFINEFINGYTKENKHIKNISLNLKYELQRLYFKLGYISTDIGFIEDNYVWFKPISINKNNIENIIVYNFEVAIDNSYIVQNTIVHNCQGFSIAGKRDIRDPRNSLFMEFVKYIDYFHPKAFIMENVIGILSMKTLKNEKVIDIILDELSKNYNCIVCKLYASDFEVPQNRRRTIIIGIRKDLNIIPTEPKPILSINERIPVKNILLDKNEIDKSYYLSNKALEGIANKKQKSINNGNGFGAQYLDMDKPSYTIPARYWKDGYDALVKYSDTEIRRLTILELKRIQSFPDDYIIEGTKKDIIMQIGNAVACKFGYYLGKHIINTLQ